jgi:hypothetical protein
MGVSVLVANRNVSRERLEAATQTISLGLDTYRTKGIHIVSHGGFASDFDGLKVVIDDQKSSAKDHAHVQKLLETDTGVPVSVSFGGRIL